MVTMTVVGMECMGYCPITRVINIIVRIKAQEIIAVRSLAAPSLVPWMHLCCFHLPHWSDGKKEEGQTEGREELEHRRHRLALSLLLSKEVGIAEITK